MKLHRRQLFNEDVIGEPVLAIATSRQNKTVIAVDPTCPHYQCHVTWRRDLEWSIHRNC